MNWVDRRAKSENNLSEGAPKLWKEVKAALEDACASYNDCYDKEGKHPVKIEPSDDQFIACKNVRLVISETGYRDESIKIFINLVRSGIKVDGAGPVTPKVFPIGSDEKGAFIGTSTERTEADQLSQTILEPLLFPSGKYIDIS